jgi:hypothetical protein
MREQASALDTSRLLRIAQESLKLDRSAPAGDVHIGGLCRLAAGMERQAAGDAAALRVARRELYGWITAYLSFLRDLEQQPEIAAVPVERPLFVVGLGRVGSTLLHNLLALAPGARAPRLWEILTPSPPLADRGAAGPRIDIARRRLALLAAAAPAVLSIHPMAPEAPDECHWMMLHSPLWVMLYGVPEYWAWLKALSIDELRTLYAHYRLQVQHLMLFQRGRWVSKAFSHLHFLPVLFDIFPDARIVRLHRDPTAAIPSLSSLARSYRSIFSTRVDAQALGAGMLDLFLDGMARSMALDGDRPHAPVVDIAFAELVADPIAVVRRIQETLDDPLDETSERAMRAYLDRAAAAPAFHHRYSLEEFGLSRAEVLDRSATYLAWAEARCGRTLVGA